MSKFNTPQKIRKFLSNVHKIEDAHFQCVDNHYAKFEYKGMKTFGVIDYTYYAPQKCCGRADMDGRVQKE